MVQLITLKFEVYTVQIKTNFLSELFQYTILIQLYNGIVQ
jgi:hypothetical protein